MKCLFERKGERVNKYSIQIKIPGGKVEEILNRLTEAQRVIVECYNELRDLGVLVIEEKTVSGN